MRLFSLSCTAPLLGALVCILMGGVAFGHGIYIHAWVENGQICTQSYYSKSSVVAGAKVSMATPQGHVLHSQTSNEAGKACFAPPITNQNLLFIVDAGQGHRGEYPLDKAIVQQTLPAVYGAGTTNSSLDSPFPNASAGQERVAPSSQPVQTPQSAAALAGAQQRAKLGKAATPQARQFEDSPATKEVAVPLIFESQSTQVEELRKEVYALRTAVEDLKKHTKGNATLPAVTTIQPSGMPDAQGIIAGLALIASLTALGVACHKRKGK